MHLSKGASAKASGFSEGVRRLRHRLLVAPPVRTVGVVLAAGSKTRQLPIIAGGTPAGAGSEITQRRVTAFRIAKSADMCGSSGCRSSAGHAHTIGQFAQQVHAFRTAR